MTSTTETNAFLAARRAIMEELRVTSAHASNVLRQLGDHHHKAIAVMLPGAGRLSGILGILREAAAQRSAEARARFLRSHDAPPLPPPTASISGP